jgi:hypothetical protein
MKVVIWFGPASTSQLAGAALPDVDRLIVIGGACPPGKGAPECQGSTYFSNLAEQWNDGQRYLPKLLRSKGIDAAAAGLELWVGSFSAGHGAVKKLCMADADRALITGVTLADSTFCAWSGKDAAPSEGYVRMALDAVHGPKLFLATASSSEDPAGNTPSGMMCMAAIRAEVERRAGIRFRASPFWPAAISPAPEAVWQAGNCILAEYGARVTHPQHASVLARQVWQHVVTPWAGSEQTCFAVATSAPAIQGFGVDTWQPDPGQAVACTMWGRWPQGGVPPVVAETGLGQAGKLLAFGAGAVLAFAAGRAAQTWITQRSA